MEFEKKLIIKALKEEKVDFFLKAWGNLSSKSAEKAKLARIKGNELFNSKKHDSAIHEVILRHYSQSVALAPTASEEMALAYGNRSALLIHLKMFSDCITDINRALNITKNTCLKVKLLCRKMECLTELGLEERTKVNEQIKNLINSYPKHDKKRNILLEYAQRTKVDVESNYSNLVTIPQTGSKHKIKITDNPFKNVSIKHNTEYGRFLVANRNIRPGEVVMCLKPFVTATNITNTFIFCGHCLSTCYNMIPCDYCSLYMFCSENCKTTAWDTYHNIECKILTYIKFDQTSDYYKQMAIKIIAAGIRETGSIANLEQSLLEVDECKDPRMKGFTSRDFNSFRNIYSLSSKVSDENLSLHIDHATITLVCLAKGTKLFGDKNFKTSEDLLKNEDVLFIGALLLKLCAISDINAICIMEGSSYCRFSKEPNVCDFDRCCERGICLGTLPSLMNSSCFPNVRRCFSEDMNLVVYALRPISKNSQLFDSYSAMYFNTPKSVRQSILKESFNFTCNCQPCIQDWPQVLLMTREDYLENKNMPNRKLEVELHKKNEYVINYTDLDKIEYRFDEKTLQNLSKDIEKAMKHLEQPSQVTMLLINTLWTIFDKLYGIKFKIPDNCDKIDKGNQ